MRYLALQYMKGWMRHAPPNIGDDLQTLAAMEVMPRVDGFIDKEELGGYESDGEKKLVILNGYFLHGTSWPPGRNVVPVFFGFHIAAHKRSLLLSENSINYYRRWQPIYCRDEHTAGLLRDRRIDARCGGCLVTAMRTLPKRGEPSGETLIVQGAVQAGLFGDFTKRLPEGVVRDSSEVSHYLANRGCDYTQDQKFAAMWQLLHRYSTASLVMTSFVHCALPCIVMGVPLMFFHHANDPRVDCVRRLGVKVHDISGPAMTSVDATETVNINLAAQAASMRDTVNEMLCDREHRFS